MTVPAPHNEALIELLDLIRGCRLCAESLPLGPRPVLCAAASARLLIAGQAPGTRAHETGIPWNDASGDRLRGWLGLDRDNFYDARRIAIVPMGFCYPGRDARGGDRPPRPECAPAWQGRLRPHLACIGLTLLVGQYAQAWYLGARRRASLTETVRAWAEYAPDYLPLPHPSWRTTGWARRNPWFAAEVLPALRARIARLLADGAD
jgi:uracil-DNA glycosylase